MTNEHDDDLHGNAFHDEDGFGELPNDAWGVGEEWDTDEATVFEEVAPGHPADSADGYAEPDDAATHDGADTPSADQQKAAGAGAGETAKQRSPLIAALMAFGCVVGVLAVFGVALVYTGLLPLGGDGRGAVSSVDPKQVAAAQREAEAQEARAAAEQAGAPQAPASEPTSASTEAMLASIAEATDGGSNAASPMRTDAPAMSQRTAASSEATTMAGAGEGAADNHDSGGASDSGADTPTGISEQRVREIVDEATAMAELAEGTPSISEAELAAMRERITEQATRLGTLIERVDTLRSDMEQAITDAKARDADTDSGGGAAVPDDLAASFEAINKRVWTALANSRLALDAARQVGDVDLDADWRELSDGGDAAATSPANEGGERADTSEKHDTSAEPKGPVLEGWTLVGVGQNRAMIRSEAGETYLVQPGDRVRGAGRVMRIEPQHSRVVTESGVIRG